MPQPGPRPQLLPHSNATAKASARPPPRVPHHLHTASHAVPAECVPARAPASTVISLESLRSGPPSGDRPAHRGDAALDDAYDSDDADELASWLEARRRPFAPSTLQRAWRRSPRKVCACAGLMAILLAIALVMMTAHTRGPRPDPRSNGGGDADSDSGNQQDHTDAASDPRRIIPSLLFSPLSPAGRAGWLWSHVADTDSTSLEPWQSPSPGQWVPCPWIEERFGTNEAFARLAEQIKLTPKFRTAPALTETAVAAARSAILSAVGLHCESIWLHQAAVRADQQPLQSSSDARWIDQWMSQRMGVEQAGEAASASASDTVASSSSVRLGALPVVAVREDLVYGTVARLTSVTGALAYLSCAQQQVQAGTGGFSPAIPRAAFVSSDVNNITDAYAQFVDEARHTDSGENGAGKQSDTVAADKTNQTALGDPPAIAPLQLRLLPLLPSMCGLSSLFRPASARRCLANQRIIGFGDSTMQELMQHLLDLLETPDDGDGGDPDALLWDLPNERDFQSPTLHPQGQSQSHDSPSLSRAADSGYHLYHLHAWGDPSSCYSRGSHYEERVFSTARLPSPYLAAYNITVAMRWNVDANSCADFSQPSGASDPSVWKLAYRMMRDSCLEPRAAIAFVKRIRRGDFESDPSRKAQLSSGTVPMTRHEYINTANARFPRRPTATDGEAEPETATQPGRPGFSCAIYAANSSTPYLSGAQLDQFPATDQADSWFAHLSALPAQARFDAAVWVMGPHYLGYWGDAMRSSDPASATAPLRAAFASSLRLSHYFSRHTVLKEINFRGTDHLTDRAMISAYFRQLMHTMQKQQAIRIARAEIIAQGGRLRAEQWEQLMDEADRGVALAANSSAPVDLPPSPVSPQLLIWPGDVTHEYAILTAIRSAAASARASNQPSAAVLPPVALSGSAPRSSSFPSHPLSSVRVSWLPELEWTETAPRNYHCTQGAHDDDTVGSLSVRSSVCGAVINRLMENLCSRKEQ